MENAHIHPSTLQAAPQHSDSSMEYDTFKRTFSEVFTLDEAKEFNDALVQLVADQVRVDYRPKERERETVCVCVCV